MSKAKDRPRRQRRKTRKRKKKGPRMSPKRTALERRLSGPPSIETTMEPRLVYGDWPRAKVGFIGI